MTFLDVLIVAVAASLGVAATHVAPLLLTWLRARLSASQPHEPKGLGYEDTEPLPPSPPTRPHPTSVKIEVRAQEIYDTEDAPTVRGRPGRADNDALGRRLDLGTGDRSERNRRIRAALERAERERKGEGL